MTLPQLRNMNDLTSYLKAMEDRIRTVEAENDSLQRYIQEMGGDASKMLPKSAIYSPNFLRRAFAIWGHYFVAQLIISIPITCIYFVVVYLVISQGNLPTF
ncbi:MAG: hypothetical protein ABIJ39_11510 [Chloroflexota bacterium]